MTNEEAIKEIKVAIAEIEWAYPMNYAAAFDKAVEALEKQIPQKPMMIESDYGDRIYACNSCKRPIVNVWSRDDYKPKYCHYCGQRLDWSNHNGNCPHCI